MTSDRPAYSYHRVNDRRRRQPPALPHAVSRLAHLSDSSRCPECGQLCIGCTYVDNLPADDSAIMRRHLASLL